MTIERYSEILGNIEEKLSSVLVANDMSRTMEIIRDELLGAHGPEERQQFNPDIMEGYLDAKAIEGRAKSTIERYRYVLTKALEHIGLPERKITVHHLRAYLMSERQRGISDGTLEGIRSAFSAYFDWLHKEALISKNPCTNLGTIKGPKVMRLPYSDVEIERLKEACGEIRDKAIICFLLATGCRISEVVALDRNDVDMQRMCCKVLGKGSKERVVYIDNVTRMHLRKYLAARTDLSPALFAGKGSERMTPGGVRKMLKTVGEIAHVENVHPHRFRRTLATNLINRGMPIQEVARVLGHDKLDTTMEYIYIDDRDVQTSYRKYS